MLTDPITDVLAVIPARGGSIGIPHKNLREAGGISLVGRAARFARSLPQVGAVVVSSDDPAIIAEARAHGADAPFVRPEDLSHGSALSVDTWRHAWLESEAHYGRRFEVSILLEPTSPLRRAADAEAVLEALRDPAFQSAATVTQIPRNLSPPKVFRRADTGRLIPNVEDTEAASIRQLLEPYYRRNGLCYAVRREAVVDNRTIIGHDCAGILTEREVVSIDDMDELALADRLLREEDQA